MSTSRYPLCYPILNYVGSGVQDKVEIFCDIVDEDNMSGG